VSGGRFPSGCPEFFLSPNLLTHLFHLTFSRILVFEIRIASENRFAAPAGTISF
jgi:hypothetical protein